MTDAAAPACSIALVKTIEDFRTELRLEVKLTRIRLERVELAIDRSTAAVNDLEARLTYVEQRIDHQADRIIAVTTDRARGRG